MALNDLTDQNIQDTYQKVVQTDGTNLADGTGSLLPISFDGNNVTISGSITANEYIVSSSVTNITVATLSGSTAFGDSIDDTHQFTGNITASGNISSSGNIYAIRAHLSDILLPNDSRIIYNNDDITLPDTGLAVLGNITSSGNISSSGDIIADQFNSKGSQYKLNGDKALYLDSTDLYVGHHQHKTYITSSGIVDISGHITASGNISSSGTIEGVSIRAVNNGLSTNAISNLSQDEPYIELNNNFDVGIGDPQESANGTHILIDDTNTKIDFETLNAQFGGHITASGNISSSGIVTGEHLASSDGISATTYVSVGTLTNGIQLNGLGLTTLGTMGNIIASGNISSSGTIFAHQIETDQLVSRIGDANTGLQFDSDTVTIQGNNEHIAQFNSTNIKFTENLNSTHYISGSSLISDSHITASGNISASGNMKVGNITLATNRTITGIGLNVSALQYRILNSRFATPGADPNNFVIGDDASPIGVKSLTLLHITASGNISSSAVGTISAGSGSFHVLKGDTTAATGLSVAGYIEATNITASGNISSSGAVIGTNFQAATSLQVNGKRILYNNDDLQIRDTGLDVVGHITASGNISSSNKIFSKYLYVDERIYPSNSIGGVFFSANANSIMVNGGSLDVRSHITASGNISSSGTIIGNKIKSNGHTIGFASPGTQINLGFENNTPIFIGKSKNPTIFMGNVTASGNISASGDLDAGGLNIQNTHNNIISPSLSIGNVPIGVGYGLRVDGNAQFDDNINLTGHLTASGNISSSGGVYATGIFNNGRIYPNYPLSVNHFLRAKTSTNPIISAEGGLDVVGNVTASGNISASGDVYGSDFYVSGHKALDYHPSSDSILLGESSQPLNVQSPTTFHLPITASGNISASGNIYSANEKTIVYSVYTKSTRADKWYGPKKQGTHGSGLWNQIYSTPTGTTSRLFLNSGFVIPEKAKYTSFQVSAVLGTGTANLPITASFGVIDSILDTDNVSNPTIVQLDSSSAMSDSGGSNYDQIQISSSLAAGTIIPKNSMIYPRFRWGTDQTSNPGTIGSAELYLQVQFRYIPIK